MTENHSAKRPRQADRACPSDLRAIDALRNGPMRPMDFAASIGVPKRTARGVLRRLVESGVVMRRQALKDARNVYYVLKEVPDARP